MMIVSIVILVCLLGVKVRKFVIGDEVRLKSMIILVKVVVRVVRIRMKIMFVRMLWCNL